MARGFKNRVVLVCRALRPSRPLTEHYLVRACDWKAICRCFVTRDRYPIPFRLAEEAPLPIDAALEPRSRVPVNPHLKRRLEAILSQLRAAHDGHGASSATRGAEREAFVDLMLRGCMPAPYRFGSGEVTDAHGNVSGQIDVVIEHAFFPSFPLLGTAQQRLYLIEGVAIAIEVKSSAGQFDKAVETMRKFRALEADADFPKEEKRHRMLLGAIGTGVPTSFPERMGFAIVVFKGFSKPETLIERCALDDVDVVLQFDPPIFHARNFRQSGPKTAVGPQALAAFLFVVNDELNSLGAWNSNVFRRYVEQAPPPREPPAA